MSIRTPAPAEAQAIQAPDVELALRPNELFTFVAILADLVVSKLRRGTIAFE